MFYDRVFLHNIIDYSWLFYKAIIETASVMICRNHWLPFPVNSFCCRREKLGMRYLGPMLKKWHNNKLITWRTHNPRYRSRSVFPRADARLTPHLHLLCLPSKGGNGGGNINIDEGVDKKQKHNNQLTHPKPIDAAVAILNRGWRGSPIARVLLRRVGGAMVSTSSGGNYHVEMTQTNSPCLFCHCHWMTSW